MRRDTTNAVRQPSKSEMLLQLALAAYRPNPADAEAQAALRKGFEAIIEELRQVEGVPAIAIDAFFEDAQACAGIDALMIPAVMLGQALPDANFQAAIVRSGMLDAPPKPPSVHPKFVEAGEALMALNEHHGDAVLHSPKYQSLFHQMLKYAPPEFMQTLREGAKQFGLLPETKFVNDVGQPVYTSAQIAEKFGVPIEEVEKFIDENAPDMREVGNVHQVQ
ncbi:hypothetical protein [Ottowia testudinis]|uniref:Uncharacterized protein n=1 Tax=Ottowia testudinis TaxID=2816950 RepID=A0A975CI26_9BURK|nr:hypothetical protein [Ottowia testudinis]QTD44579.1 hypothetical protein J1M35_15995 [Ottowia testudinis]